MAEFEFSDSLASRSEWLKLNFLSLDPDENGYSLISLYCVIGFYFAIMLII